MPLRAADGRHGYSLRQRFPERHTWSCTSPRIRHARSSIFWALGLVLRRHAERLPIICLLRETTLARVRDVH